MPNTIQLKLLENKTIVPYVNGYPYSYEGGYRIIAGEENATEFEISSVPKQYENATFSVRLINSRGYQVPNPVITNNKFILPVGMAVAGYGQILISAKLGSETVVWSPLYVKIWDTDPNWKSNANLLATIQIGDTITLPPGSNAIVENVGTSQFAVLNFSIPQGPKGEKGERGEQGMPALECDYIPKGNNPPEYYIENTFSFGYDSFNRTPVVGDNFITPYEQTNTGSFFVSWKVVTTDGTAKCNAVAYINAATNAVTIDGDQTITGKKTFLSKINVTPQDGRRGVNIRSGAPGSIIELDSFDQTRSFSLSDQAKAVIRDIPNNKVLAMLSFPEQIDATLATTNDVENAKTEAIQSAVRTVNDSMEVIFSLTADGLLHVEENNKSEVI